jgi:hypothetical protein
MVLDIRLKKLARGLSVREAALAPLQRAAGAWSRKGDPGHDPDGLRDDERAQAAEFEATIEAMFLMAAVDGEVTDAELGQLAASVEAMVDVSQPEQRVKVDRLLGELNDRLAKEGWKARLDATAARLVGHEARTFAFRLAAGVAFVDDHVAHAEAAAIDALQAALALTADESQEILHDVQETLFG